MAPFRFAGTLLLIAAPSAAWTVVDLDVPPLEEIAKALHAGLAKRYQDAEVLVLPRPPDLTKFGWMLPGLGTPTLLDVGNTGFLKVAHCHNSTYNVTDLARDIPEIGRYLPHGAWYGAAAAYRPLMGVNGELLGDAMLDRSRGYSYGGYVAESGDMATMPMPTDGIGPFASLFVTDGAASPVLSVTVKGLLPSDEERFDWAVQKALVDASDVLGSVGLAGIVRLLSGSVTFHVMTDFTYDHDISADEFKEHFERFFDHMEAPLDCSTRMVSRLDLLDNTTKGAHTHCRSPDLKRVGHYENDTVLPDGVLPHVFQAYLVPAATLVRVTEATDPACRMEMLQRSQGLVV